MQRSWLIGRYIPSLTLGSVFRISVTSSQPLSLYDARYHTVAWLQSSEEVSI